MVYTTGQVLDSKQADALKEISRVVQEQSGLKINATYQNLYSSVVQKITQMFYESMQPLTASEWGNFSVASETKKKREGRVKSSEERKIFHLHKESNDYLIHQIFSVRVEKPMLTVDKFLEIANKKENWYTHKYLFSSFQQEIFNYAKEKTIPVGYYLSSKLVTSLISAPKLLTSIKETRWEKLHLW